MSALVTPLATAQRIIAALIAAALSASLGLAWLAGRILAGPMRQLAASARALGTGEHPSFTPTFMRESNVVGDALVEAGARRQRNEAALRESEARL